MARYFSVEEAANILGTTDRTVRRMLNAGKLAGSQHMDKGKLVWRVHATKEILQKVTPSIEDPIETDATVVESMAPDDEPDVTESWRQDTTGRATAAVDEFWNQLAEKFLEKIEQKDQAIGALKVELSEKDRQLRLLPDLQKRLQDEQDQRNLAAQQSVALEKQIEAMKQLSDEEKSALEAKLQISEEQKLEEINSLKNELLSLRSEVSKLKKPWWQKLFGAPDDDSASTDG